MKLFIALLFLMFSTGALARLGEERELILERLPINDYDGEYIIIFDKSITDMNDVISNVLGSLSGVEVLIEYTALKGVLVSGLDEVTAKTLESSNLVAVVSKNSAISIDAIQSNVDYGLDRIDQSNLPLNGDYSYDCEAEDVFVYVMDTGIKLEHEEFEGRASCGAYFVDDTCDDLLGHGTHVAGIVGSRTYGVAKKANLVTVKVFGRTGGSFGTVLQGLDYITHEKLTNPLRKMVVNMSFTGGRNESVDRSIDLASFLGVWFVAAAGNWNKDACGASPAAASGAISVAASDQSDQRADFSNWGDCVDLFAPGKAILSTYRRSTSDKGRMSGTSMSSPFVAGVAALYLSTGKTKQDLLDDATEGVLKGDLGAGSPNALLNMERACEKSFGL